MKRQKSSEGTTSQQRPSDMIIEVMTTPVSQHRKAQCKGIFEKARRKLRLEGFSHHPFSNIQANCEAPQKRKKNQNKPLAEILSCDLDFM
jgi:hypothetical protein